MTTRIFEKGSNRPTSTDYTYTPTISATMDVSKCNFCTSQVRSEDLKEHIHLEHEAALFGCGFCSDEVKFETFDKVREHIKQKHQVLMEELITSEIKIPEADFLKEYVCNLCQDTFSAVTEDKLFDRHFKQFHKINKIKPAYLSRSCRICAYKKAKNDSDLVKHINEAHPRSSFCQR